MIDFEWDLHSVQVKQTKEGYTVYPYGKAQFKTLSLWCALQGAFELHNSIDLTLKCGTILQNPKILREGRYSILVKHKDGEHIV